jgi:hypothetical protein
VATRTNPARDLIDTATLRRLSALSGADPRTVDKVLLGKPVRGDVAIRILAVLHDAGITPVGTEAVRQ